jgi:hypothetical protein
MLAETLMQVISSVENVFEDMKLFLVCNETERYKTPEPSYTGN